MTVVYVPVYKMAISYTVNFGRRWSILEHVILVELAKQRRSVSILSQLCNLPGRLVIEALINLLRAGWIEVRATDEGVAFAATAIGTKRAGEEALPVTLHKKVKWITLCAERLTGAWLREADLQLVHENDLPPSAKPLEPVLSTYDADDGTVRDLLYLDNDESFEHFQPNFRAPTRLLARFELAFDQVVELPTYAPLSLERAIRDRAPLEDASVPTTQKLAPDFTGAGTPHDTLGIDDIIVGGPEHLAFVKQCLADARTHFILHSCFLDSKVIGSILPELAAAARRGVHVDLLWGLAIRSGRST